MSLDIDCGKVKEVMLSDGWHKVDAGTFDLDAYEFTSAGSDVLLGGACKLVSSTGATWEDGGRKMFCPITAILAVSY